MLSGVLLHVVEATVPVDHAVGRRDPGSERPGEHVRDSLALVDNIDHGDAA